MAQLSWIPSSPTLGIVANGAIPRTQESASLIKALETLVAVDGGLETCHSLNITPSLIIGDFDSAAPSLLEKYKAIPQLHTPDPDKTDLEKALEFLFSFPLEKVVVFGALGNRTDHTLNNLYLLARYPHRVFYESERETLFAAPRSLTLNCVPGQTLSFIPLNGPVRGVTTKGLNWELKGVELNKKFISISNSALEREVSLTIEEGDLLICLNKEI